MNKTNIEWVKNPDGSQGYTWNPVTGCLHGCTYCYARQLANGRLKSRYLAQGSIPCEELSNSDPFSPRFWPKKLDEPKSKGTSPTSKGIFVCSMADLFGNWVPYEWQEKVLNVVHDCPQHRFYFLTKAPWNLRTYNPWPDNAWVGATVTDEESFVKALIHLPSVKASVRFISIEPLLSHITLRNAELLVVAGIHWLILGAQTKPSVLPDPQWVAEIVSSTKSVDIPVFLKDSMKKALGVGAVMQEMPLCLSKGKVIYEC